MQLTLDNTVSKDLALICQKYFIKKLSVFGSSVRGEDYPESDLDILVEFLPGHIPGFAFMSLQEELSSIFHRNVDLHTPSSLSQYFRESVLREAQPIYG